MCHFHFRSKVNQDISFLQRLERKKDLKSKIGLVPAREPALHLQEKILHHHSIQVERNDNVGEGGKCNKDENQIKGKLLN